MTIELGGAQPILRVADLAASIDYYVKSMGFTVDFATEGVFASVGRDRCHFYLCQGDQGHPGTWAWIGVNDAAALEADLRTRGAKIRQTSQNFPWAYEMQVEDLDGNVLRFGSGPKPGEPYGSFLDMEGRLWPIPASTPMVCD